MQRTILATLLLTSLDGPASANRPIGQPKFEATDVHVSAKTAQPFARTGPPRGGRYEIKNATIVDLIRIAYGFDPDKVLGGPSWLETDRFDVIGKLPPNSTPDAQKLMPQAVLEDRFKLAVHKDTTSGPISG